MKNYKQFRDELQHAYPVSKGKIKLPIATKLVDFPDLKLNDDIQQIKKDLQDFLLRLQKNENLLSEIIHKNNEDHIIPLLRRDFTGIIRVDIVLNAENKLKILEINADYPDGLLLHDFTYSTLDGKESKLHNDLFLSLFNKQDKIFVMYKEGSFFKDAYYQEYLILKNAGFEVYFGADTELDFNENGYCFYKNKLITIIKRCMEVGKFSDTLLKQFTKNKVGFINTFDLRVAGYKNMLPLLNSSYLPQTWTLTTQNRKQFIKNKDRLILKPSNLFEGKGIVIGKQTSLEEREGHLESKSKKNYIVQELIEMQKLIINLYDNNEIVEKELYFDLCPHFFVKDGKIIGDGHILMRFSENRILNVAKGGGIGYLKK